MKLLDGELIKAYDIWLSDENDRSCIGVVGIRYTPEYHESDDALAWRALDAALDQECKPEVRDKLEFPFMEAGAVYDFLACECPCHIGMLPYQEEETEDGGHEDGCSEDSEYCYSSESIFVEECDDPENDYWHHTRVALEDL